MELASHLLVHGHPSGRLSSTVSTDEGLLPEGEESDVHCREEASLVLSALDPDIPTNVAQRSEDVDLQGACGRGPVPHLDVERGEPSYHRQATDVDADAKPDFKLSIADVNPLGPAWQVLRQRSNVVILFASGVCSI